MIKLIYKLTILLIGFMVFDYMIGLNLDYIIKKTPDGRYYKALYSLEKCKEDIVLFGASRSETNLVPTVFEKSLKMTCWNTGRGGQGLPFWLSMEHGITKRYIPKIAIVDIVAENLSSDISDSYEAAGFLRPFYFSHKEIQPVLNKITFFEQYFIYSNLYAYNSSFYYLFRPYFFKGLDGSKDDKGWKPLNGQMSLVVSNPQTINSDQNLNNKTVLLFNEFISNLSNKGCKVFVIISPHFNETIIKTSTIEYIKHMKGVTLISFDDNCLFTENYYKDPDHLNKEGAVKFSKLLVEKIQNTFKN